MALWDGYDAEPFRVVGNDRGHRSVWPDSRPLPAGWTAAGFRSTLGECLAEIDRMPLGEVSATGIAAGGTAARPAVPGGSAVHGAERPVPDVAVTRLIWSQGLPEDACAIREGTTEVTRRDLQRTSRAWGQVLAAEGCGVGALVVIALPRSADAVTAILAVLEAGGAYVPLPVDASAERAEAVLRDCRPSAVITTPELAGKFQDGARQVLTVTDLASRAGQATAVSPGSSSGDLAYIFYTSGTTGEPKGVEGTHAQLVNYALWCRDAFAHQPGEVTFLTAALYFLGSLTTIFTPLLAGWPIVIAPEGATTDAVLDMTWGEAGGLLKLTPSHLRMMTARGVPRGGLARQLMIGSEPLTFTPELAQWLRSGPDRTAVNHYGLTETHGCLCHRLSGQEREGARIPAGIPVSNVQAYIVDRHGGLTEPGEPGELLVGGPSIGNGYHRRPSLTAARWIPHPWGFPGERLLRTGDLARLEPGGAIMVLGRADRQVKIRGHRVEPSAVEELLRAMPEVKEALVLPSRVGEEVVLSAYLLPRGQTGIDPAAVCERLEVSLPAEWIPARVAVVDELPVNGHGKVDTSRLPPASPVRRSPGLAVAGGRWSPAELVIGGVYCEVLGVEGVALDDDFYMLSGSSLGAVEAAARIGKLLGRDVPVPEPSAATVREYARQVDGRPSGGQPQGGEAR